jgi:hypothetical protein
VRIARYLQRGFGAETSEFAPPAFNPLSIAPLGCIIRPKN